MKILQLTDLHLVPPGGARHGLDPARRLRTALDHALERHGDANLIVLTGDLADAGAPEAYELLASILREVRLPVRLLLGNHDDRASFLRFFPGAERDTDGHVQGVLDAPDEAGRLVFLDTMEPGWIGGRLCASRFAWLDRVLAEAAERPVTVFMHHPPGSMGVPHFARIGLAEPDRFLHRLAAHPGGVRHVFVGHVHLDIVAYLQGIPCAALRAVSHQMELSLATRTPYWIDVAPAYRVILLGADALTAFTVAAEPSSRIGQTSPCDGP